MVWRNIFLLLIFCINFLVNSFAPPGINPSIFDSSIQYKQEHRPVISKDGSSNIPRSPYEPPTAIFATRPPLPGYYKATKPFTRGPFPYVPITESPIKIELKNPQDLLEELKNNRYYGEIENVDRNTKKIVSDTGIFYPVQKTHDGDMIGYVNVPYYEVPVTQSVKSQKVLILDDKLSTTTKTTTTTTTTSTTNIIITTTTKKSVITTVKSTTTTKKNDIPEVIKDRKSKVVTTSNYLLNTQSTAKTYPVVDITKQNTTPYARTPIQIPEINKYNYQKINTKYNKYPDSISNSNSYEAIPISPDMYYSNFDRNSNTNYNNLQPSPPMTGGYYGPQLPVTKKKTNNLTPFFTRTKPHLATISPITEKNINSIVSQIKDKKTTTTHKTFTITTIKPIKTTENIPYQKLSSKIVTQKPWWMISTTNKPLIILSTNDVKFEKGFSTITTRRPKVTEISKSYSTNPPVKLTSQFLKTVTPLTTITTVKFSTIPVQRTTKKPLIIISTSTKINPSIIVFSKSTKAISLPSSTTGTTTVEFLSTVPSTKKVEQTVTFGETKKLNKEEIKSIKGNVEFNFETNTFPTLMTTSPEVTFEKGSNVITEKIITKSPVIFEDHTQKQDNIKTTTSKFTTIEIEPSIIDHEINESTKENTPTIKINPTSVHSTKGHTIDTTTFTMTPKIISRTTTLPQIPEVITNEIPKNTIPNDKKESDDHIVSTTTTTVKTQPSMNSNVETSKTTVTKITNTEEPEIEITSIPFIPEGRLFESTTTEKSIENTKTIEKETTEIPTTEESFIDLATTEKKTKEPSFESSTVKETTEQLNIESSTVESIEPKSSFTTQKINIADTSTKLFEEDDNKPTPELVKGNTQETSTLSIPQQHSESLFPEQENSEEMNLETMTTTVGVQNTKEMLNESFTSIETKSFKTIETTSISNIDIESTVIPTEIFSSSTQSSTDTHETTPSLLEEFETTPEISTQSTQIFEASTHAFTTEKPEINSTQKTEIDSIPFTPIDNLFTLNGVTETTTNGKVVVDFDSETVTKNITELCTTEQSISTTEVENITAKTLENQSTEVTLIPIELSEETTTPVVEILFPTFPSEEENLSTERVPTTNKNLKESTEILEFTTSKLTTSEEGEIEEKTTSIPVTISTSIPEISTSEKVTPGDEVFPTEFSSGELTTPTTNTTEQFFFSSIPTTEEDISQLPINSSTNKLKTTLLSHTLTSIETTTEMLFSETTTTLIKSVVILNGNKKVPVVKAPETTGIEFISPNMTITKILDKSTNKFVPNGKNTNKTNLVSIQVTTDMEKSVELADIDFEKTLEKELDKLIPKILETLDKEEKEIKELGEHLEKGIGEELEKEVRNNDDVDGKNKEELLKQNFIDRDYPDFNPPKDKVFDSNILRSDDVTVPTCPYEPYVSSEPPTDVMFLVDGTKSMSGENFERSLKMMGDFVMKFDNIGLNGTQFSLVQYTSQPFFEFSFKKHSCRDDILKDIIETSYMKGDNNTNNLDIVLEKVNKFGFSYLRGNRPEAKDFLIIFNGDNKKNTNLGNAIEKIKDNDIEVFAICEDEDSQNIFNDILPPKNVMSFNDNNKNVVDIITNNIKKYGNKNKNNDDINIIKTDCMNDELRVVLEVPKSYQGIFTTKNFSNNSLCSKKVPMEIGDGYKQLGFTFKNNDCGLNIIHDNELNGKNYTIVMNVLKDDKEISQNDKSYLVQCFSSNKNIENDEKKVVFDTIPIDIVPPTCKYSLHRDSMDGPIVSMAVLGQTIFHKWECHGMKNVENYYGMFIHDCFIGTHEKKNILQMVDNNGCVTKNTTINGINYESEKMIAYAKSEVFSLEDVEHMKFSCKIGLCLKQNGDCDGITPPQCNKTENNLMSAVIRQDRQINLINQALENDVETILQIIKSFRFGAQKFVNNNGNFSYKEFDGPIISIMLITLIVSLSIFIVILTYKKYKHPIHFTDDDIFSNSYNSNNFYNSSISNSSKLNLDNINFEEKDMYNVNYSLINLHKKTSVTV
ncbi:Zona pellucida domain and von Willebrand factor, type A domain-containing protein [Strongyloides ratti]|uniref:Zona pellucida domain and von Willebrand factor, type A domain-containing protein n=1 Tax=Strongyloides ratti TaxID=34506 RepID=A0A090LFP2_STRRB|nr:Zona pellucida domain and von Willebrand factor, type A domain-containing protein [Strongyloides ratti]CEF68582.1 Zona pellucida domain and von Willebrand factor, type A domain-containing protein [Strongyloides ratti]